MRRSLQLTAILTLLTTMACTSSEEDNHVTPDSDSGMADMELSPADMPDMFDMSPPSPDMMNEEDMGLSDMSDMAPSPDMVVEDMSPVECNAGDTRCVEYLQQTCGEDGTWAEPLPCEAGAICNAEACEAVSETLRQQGEALEGVSASLRDYTGYAEPFDFESVLADATQQLYLGDGSLYNFYKQVFHIFDSLPQGHAAIGMGPLDYSSCFVNDGPATIQFGTWYGVCSRRRGDHSIVTFVSDDSSLGLLPGDQVVGLTRDGVLWGESEGFLERLSQEPVCASSVPNREARLEHAAVNLFGMIREGDVLSVLRVDGTTAQITAGPRGENLLGCSDPLRREERHSAFSTYQRADGVVVVILPTLGHHPERPFPMNLTPSSYRDWVAAGITAINEALAGYDSIAGIVWDIRGNSGGAQELGIGLMDSFGDAAGSYGNCYGRLPASSPAAFSSSAEYPLPYAIFVDEPLPSISFTGPQVLLTDGLAASAADWMSFAAARAGIPVMGNHSMGSYGYQTGGSFVDRSLEPEADVHDGVSLFISGAHCVDAAGMEIEGLSSTDTVVEFEPSDLAAGIDTQLEQAAAALLAPDN